MSLVDLGYDTRLKINLKLMTVYSTFSSKYSKTCLKRPLKNRQTKILMTNGSLMKVESIAECSPWSILQYFWPALSDD